MVPPLFQTVKEVFFPPSDEGGGTRFARDLRESNLEISRLLTTPRLTSLDSR